MIHAAKVVSQSISIIRSAGERLGHIALVTVLLHIIQIFINYKLRLLYSQNVLYYFSLIILSIKLLKLNMYHNKNHVILEKSGMFKLVI